MYKDNKDCDLDKLSLVSLNHRGPVTTVAYLRELIKFSNFISCFGAFALDKQAVRSARDF